MLSDIRMGRAHGYWAEEGKAKERWERENKGTHSIDDEQLSTHVLARGAREEDDGAGKVPWLAPPTRRDALRDLAQTDRVCEQFLVPVRVRQ